MLMRNESGMKKAAIYIRVSTTEQSEHGYSVPEQRERLVAYCKAMNWEVTGIFPDPGYSGKDTNRPGLQGLLSDIKRFDVVVIYKLDRLSRSQKDTLHLIEDEFIKNGVDVVSLQETLDTTTAFGRASIGILSAFAQLERETFKERSLLGRTGRARQGKWVGTSRPPIGYDYNIEKQQLTINPYEAEQVKMVYDMFLAGIGLQKIAETMHNAGHKHKYGDWTWWGGITTMLTNTVYTGKVTFADKEFDGNHEFIIGAETFAKVQEKLSARTDGASYKRKSPFSHLLGCGSCGAKMFWLHRQSVNREPKYWCYSRYKKPDYLVKDPSCKMRIWNALEVNKIVLDEIGLLANKKEIERRLKQDTKPKSINSQVKELEKKAADLDKQISRLLELYQHESMPVEQLNERISATYDEKRGIMAMIEAITNKKEAETQTVEEIQSVAKTIKDKWDELNIIEQIELLNILIKKIVIQEDNIDIHWTFGR